MAIPKSEFGRGEVDWDAALAELENFDRQPSAAELRAAMLETVEVFRQGRLTEDELKWVLSLLAAQLATQTIERELQEILLDFGGGFDREPSFAKHRFSLPEGANRSGLSYA